MRLFADIITEEKRKRVITINESQVFDLILEAATIQDIHQKYYPQIPEDVFNQIISSDPTYRTDKPDKMGKFGKWLLALYGKGNLKLEDLYKANEYLSYFIKFSNKIEQKDIMRYGSLVELYRVVKPFMENPEQSTSKSDDVRKIKEGAEKVYEDAKWLVIVPHTQEASCYYGKGTQWCTAANYSDNYFEHYNSQGNLYINILKGTDTKYQFHFETASYMDAEDDGIQHPVAQTIGLTPELTNFYLDRYKGTAAIDLTTELYSEDIDKPDDIDNYYLMGYNDEIWHYDENEKGLVMVYRLDNYNHYLTSVSIDKRFIPILCEDDYINLFDTKTDELVFDESDDIENIKLHTRYERNFEYITVNHAQEHTSDIFSLRTMRYVMTDLPYDTSIDPINRQSINLYNRNLLLLTSKDDNGYKTMAIMSPPNGIISGQYRSIKREGMFYNGKLYTFFAFSKNQIQSNDNYNDVDILMYDGKIYPYNYFAQYSDKIIGDYFAQQQQMQAN